MRVALSRRFTERRVLDEVSEEAERIGFRVAGSADSSIAGPKGNREILLILTKEPS